MIIWSCSLWQRYYEWRHACECSGLQVNIYIISLMICTQSDSACPAKEMRQNFVVQVTGLACTVTEERPRQRPRPRPSLRLRLRQRQHPCLPQLRDKSVHGNHLVVTGISSGK